MTDIRAWQTTVAWSAAILVTFGVCRADVAEASTFNVPDGDVAGLLSAIQAANSTAEADVINLAPGGIYTLTAVAEDDGFAGGAGLPYIRSPLTINGYGATIERATGAADFRIVFVFVSALTIDGVTIRGGHGGNGSRGGGGIGITTGQLVVRNSTITGNTSLGDGGGGIASYCGALTIENSTISHNIGLGGRTGGGILNHSAPPACFATARIISSTIFENQAADPNLPGRGDAIADAFSGSEPVITVKNSVIASPAQGVGDDCNAPAGVIVSLGRTIASDASCGLTGSGDLNNTDPLLGPLDYDAGPTPSHTPLPNSPVIDAVPTALCTDAADAFIQTDQRGTTRPQGPACDIGSVELRRSYNACLLFDPTKAVRSGATIPIKLQLCDGNGNNLSSPALTLHATSVTHASTFISGSVQDSGNANPDNDFRFDASLGGSGAYIFNLGTNGLATGTYELTFTVSGDSVTYAVPFQVK